MTPPNDAWLKAQVESEEFTSKSEVVNDLIRKAREIEAIRARLIMAEQSGFTPKGRADILAEIKEEARRDGDLDLWHCAACRAEGKGMASPVMPSSNSSRAEKSLRLQSNRS